MPQYLEKSPLDLRLFLNWRLPTSQDSSRHAKSQNAGDNRSDDDNLFEKSISLGLGDNPAIVPAISHP